MATTEQLVRINAPQLATPTDRLLYASTPRKRACAAERAARQARLPATASRSRSWILIAIIVVVASVAAALVGHTGGHGPA